MREIYPAYDELRGDELQADDGFVSALWGGSGRIRSELLDPLLVRYRRTSETDLAHLNSLKSSLEGFGLACTTAGREFGAASEDADLVYDRSFLGIGTAVGRY